jgi:hypothetical protein
MAVCGGFYGARKNNCFCCALLKGNKNCPGRHTVLKHPMLSDDQLLQSSRVYFHKGAAGKEAAYAEPSLDVAGMNASDLTSLLAKVVDSWEAWREEVMLWKTAASSKQDIALIRTAVKATKTIPRLAERKLGGRSLLDDGLDLDLGVKLNLLGSALEDLIRAGRISIPLKENDAGEGDEDVGEIDKEQFEMFERINLLQQALIELSDVTKGSFKELQLGFGVRLAGMEAIIGSVSALQARTGQGGSSLVGMIEDLEEQVGHLKKSTEGQALIERVFASAEMTVQNDTVKNAFRAVMQRMVTLETTVKELKKLDSGRTEVSGSNFYNWFGTDAGANTTQVNQPLTAEFEAVKSSFKSLAARVDNLEHTMMPGHKMEGEDISVSFMGIRFSSEDDVRSYVESLCDGRFEVQTGMVTDCYSIFHALNREIFETKNKLGVVDLAKVSGLGMVQSDVYNILAAAEHGLPDFFDPPASAGKIFIDGKQGKKHRFNNIASYEIWGPVGTIKDAVRKRAETQLTRLVKTKRLELRAVQNADLRAFLTAMLDVSKDFVESVFAFLTEEYSALAEHFKDGSLCWDFACSCVEHVFKYEFEAARAVVNNPDVMDPSVKPRVLWQSLRTIAVQESFMRVGFKNHSSLASAYSRFLLTQYQQAAAELARLSKEVETSKRQHTDMSNAIEALEKRVRAAEGTANAAQNAVQKFRKHGD